MFLKSRWMLLFSICSLLPACTYGKVTEFAASAALIMDEYDTIVSDYNVSVALTNSVAEGYRIAKEREMAAGVTPPAVAPGANTPPAVAPGANTPPAVALGANTPPAVAPGANTPPAVALAAAEEAALLESGAAFEKYLEVLATLASDEVVHFGDDIDGLAKSLAANGLFKDADSSAYAQLVKLVADGVAGWTRHKQLKNTLADADPHVKALCGHFQRVARAYIGQLNTEAGIVPDLYQLPSESRGAIAEWLADIEQRKAHARAFDSAVGSIATFHEKLKSYEGDLDSDRAEEIVNGFLQDASSDDRAMQASQPGGRDSGGRGGRNRGGRR